MDRDVRKSAPDAGVDGIGAVIDAVASVLTAMRPLRRVCERLLATGLARPDDLHRYQMTRLRLLMMESANRGAGCPQGAGEVLAQRSLLEFHALVAHTGQFPEPQPS